MIDESLAFHLTITGNQAEDNASQDICVDAEARS